jgi:signal peptidase I
MLGFFQPRFLKDARLLAEGASKSLHQHRDLLSETERIRLQSLITSLKSAISFRSRECVRQAVSDLESGFAAVIPQRPHPVWSENIEAIVVAVALAVGFQAYFLKPFKIPTGSMQPTLYGMTGHPTPGTPPDPITRAVDFVKTGRTHLDLQADREEQVLGLNEKTSLNFFTFTDIVTSTGKHTVFAPRDVLIRDFGVRPGRVYGPGESIVRGYVQAGDQVFVDRISYQFRDPKRSDVFVFRTTGIRRIEMTLDPALGSQFYIKRLAGVAGDSLRIKSPDLLLDGKIATSEAFRRVMSCENGYRGYSNPSPAVAEYLTSPDDVFTVPPRSYFALGDNSYNSSDSRYWGVVPEHNVIGRGYFVYWPFSERWGFIR